MRGTQTPAIRLSCRVSLREGFLETRHLAGRNVAASVRATGLRPGAGVKRHGNMQGPIDRRQDLTIDHRTERG
jgi:hypothetical protein